MEQEPLKYLFQKEFSKMVAVISRLFGLEHIEVAEDLVSETFLQAAETWGQKGIPENPTAWLYAVAKQKTQYYFRRNRIFEEKVAPAYRLNAGEPEVIPDFSVENIQDSQLQMLFAVCNPVIAGEAQIGLALRILCGFGIDEIAEAFFSGKETIQKRLFRAKEKLRAGNVRLELPGDAEIAKRLDNVLHTIYLLFSEGYYSKTRNQVLSRDLCLEALRLGLMLCGYAPTAQPKTHALMALMCFHASRFEARQPNGELILYEAQDEALWDRDLIARGMHFLQLSLRGHELTSYHLEARIACRHCTKEDTPEKWQEVLVLYDRLLRINHAPGIVLNRLFALAKVAGTGCALEEALQLGMYDNQSYWLLLSELYRQTDREQARRCLGKAAALSKTAAEKDLIQRRADDL